MEGTSMSAPVVAGAAALVRQYLIDGWYPTGVAVKANRFSPSSALIKAILIGGAAGMKGTSRANNKPLAPPPSPFQGFGRVDLSKALPIKGDPTAWKMQLIDRASFNSSRQVHTYSINVTKATAKAGQPLIATLVWHDPPGYAGGANRALVNNLDLIVEGPFKGGKPIKTYFGNNVQGGDTYNNVEKVRVPSAQAGKWVISVRALYIYVLSPQLYSLAVLGAVDTTIPSKSNPAWTQQ